MYQAAGVVLLHEDSVYLNLRDNSTDYYPQYWSIIGGKGEEGETPEETAKRELEEETGYKTKNYITCTKGKGCTLKKGHL